MSVAQLPLLFVAGFLVVFLFRSPFLYFVFDPSKSEALAVCNTEDLAMTFNNHFVALGFFNCAYFWFCCLI